MFARSCAITSDYELAELQRFNIERDADEVQVKLVLRVGNRGCIRLPCGHCPYRRETSEAPHVNVAWRGERRDRLTVVAQEKNATGIATGRAGTGHNRWVWERVAIARKSNEIAPNRMTRDRLIWTKPIYKTAALPLS